MARVRWITGFFILLLIVVGCGQTTSVTRSQVQPSPSTTPHSSYSYTRQAGAIVLQVFRTGGIAPAAFSEVLPRWSLYGDGTLVFRATDSALMQAHLSQGQIDTVLKEVIDEKHIFASTKRDYSSYGADMFHWILHIKANGRELVVGVGDPVSSSTDVQVRRLRDIVDYLEVYASTISDTQPYVTTEVALDVQKETNVSPPDTKSPWPYSDVSLAAIARQICAQTQPCSSISHLVTLARSKLATMPIPKQGYFTQDNRTYFVYALPLLPDALYPAGKDPVFLAVEDTGVDIIKIPLVKMDEQ